MSVVPGPSASRGGIIVQPTYFTSSLYVDPCREDIETLVQEFSQKYHENSAHPFSLFKSIWVSSGWQWMHLKVFDAYARNAFLRATIRLFMGTSLQTAVRYINPPDGFHSRATEAVREHPDSRWSFVWRLRLLQHAAVHFCTKSPRGLWHRGAAWWSLFALRDLISADSEVTETLQSLLTLPSLLDTEQLSPLRSQVTHVLSQLVDSGVFYILPSSDLELCKLPREIFVPDGEEEAVAEASATARKRGRPSRRDKQKRANQATASLDAWLRQRQAFDTPELHSNDHDQVPVTIPSSRDAYLVQKRVMLDALARDEPGGEVLKTANEAVLRRLREIDEMAASQGLEVGGEGGEKTGLARIEKVVGEMEGGGCGILGMAGDWSQGKLVG
jgi:hypothetical protein